MHEVQGLFCKTGKTWIIAKFVQGKKQDMGRNWLGRSVKKNKEALGCLHLVGLGPFGAGAGWSRLGDEAHATDACAAWCVLVNAKRDLALGHPPRTRMKQRR